MNRQLSSRVVLPAVVPHGRYSGRRGDPTRDAPDGPPRPTIDRRRPAARRSDTIKLKRIAASKPDGRVDQEVGMQAADVSVYPFPLPPGLIKSEH